MMTRATEHAAGRLVVGMESDGVRPVRGLVITWWHSTTDNKKFPTLTARWWKPRIQWSWTKGGTEE